MNIEKHETESEKRKNIIKKAVLLIILLICIICYIAIPSIHNTINRVFEMFKSGDFMVVKDFVKSYGPYAAVISFLLMILQSIAAPLPSFLITFANANLFGWVKGAILSWTSAMVGATLCFYIARILGRDVVEKLTSKRGLEQIDEFFQRHGRMSILIARLLPFISFDFVSRVHSSNRPRAVASDDNILIRWRNAYWRGKATCNRSVYPVWCIRNNFPHQAGIHREKSRKVIVISASLMRKGG